MTTRKPSAKKAPAVQEPTASSSLEERVAELERLVQALRDSLASRLGWTHDDDA